MLRAAAAAAAAAAAMIIGLALQLPTAHDHHVIGKTRERICSICGSANRSAYAEERKWVGG